MSARHFAFTLLFGLYPGVLAGCASPDAGNQPGDAEAIAETEADIAAAKKGKLCLSVGKACELGASSCCGRAQCVEYSVYDYPRCIVPVADGKPCDVDGQCKSGACTNGVCGRAAACLAYGAACVVGHDTCCAGVCEEYTVYDYPRCR